MATECRQYTKAFKREAARLMETGGKPVAQLARDLEINDDNRYRWRGLYGSPSQANTNGSMDEMEAELKRLRREVEVLRQERDILKRYEHCQPEPPVSYPVIEANREVGSVERLCETLGVSMSGYPGAADLGASASRPPLI
jgi:transposase